jgi:hypothetical protein
VIGATDAHAVRSWDQLRPGTDQTLDVTFRGILEGTPFEGT